VAAVAVVAGLAASWGWEAGCLGLAVLAAAGFAAGLGLLAWAVGRGAGFGADFGAGGACSFRWEPAHTRSGSLMALMAISRSTLMP
jgi:hypothetical protein